MEKFKEQLIESIQGLNGYAKLINDKMTDDSIEIDFDKFVEFRKTVFDLGIDLERTDLIKCALDCALAQKYCEYIHGYMLQIIDDYFEDDMCIFNDDGIAPAFLGPLGQYTEELYWKEEFARGYKSFKYFKDKLIAESNADTTITEDTVEDMTESKIDTTITTITEDSGEFSTTTTTVTTIIEDTVEDTTKNENIEE